MRMLRWMSGHAKNNNLQNDCIWEKLRVALIEEKMTKTRLQ